MRLKASRLAKRNPRKQRKKRRNTLSDPVNYTNPLGGNEVVADVLAQIKKKLATDCNLRQTDGYSGGYSGKVTISLRLHAVRIAEVEMEIPITAELKGPAPEDFPAEEVVPVELDEEIQIPLEPNLKEVRQRTEENNQEVAEEETPTDEEPNMVQAARQKRKYTRRSAPELAGVAATSEEPTF
jgi:hypothetical protein